jgi:general secretion pathway protein F
MPLFRYRAYGPQGELAEGQLEASSESAVNEALWARRLVPFEVVRADAASTPWWRREIGSGEARLSPSQLAGFTREFATLSAADIPLAQTLRIMADEASPGVVRQVLERLLQEVLGGAALSAAMLKQPKSFTPEYVSVIRAGEASGALSRSLDELAMLLERRGELRARLHSALVYPAVLIVLSIASLIIIAGVLVPNIAPIFKESNSAVPGTIAFLMMLHERWAEILLAIAGVIALAGLGMSSALRSPSGRIAIHRRLLEAPVIGGYLLKRETARFARTLGTLLTAGVPLLQAMASASDTVNNRALAASLQEAQERIREGASLHKALKECSGLPALALRMISIGEQAADLGGMLLRVAAMLELQTQRTLDRFMTILTPAITLFIATLIGLLIVTIMNAVLSLNDIAIG